MTQSRWFQIVVGLLAAVGIAAVLGGSYIIYQDVAYAHALRSAGVSLDDFVFLRQARVTNERNQAQQRAQAQQAQPRQTAPNPASSASTTPEESK